MKLKIKGYGLLEVVFVNLGKEANRKEIAIIDGDVDGQFLNLLLSSSGILYEDEIIQIGIKTEYHKNLCRLSVFLGNKSNSTIQDVELSIKCDSNSLKFTTIQPISNEIPSSKQQFLVFNVECMENIANFPVLFVSFKSNVLFEKEFKVPINVARFIEPAELNREDFANRWKQIGGAPRETVENFKFGNISSVEVLKRLNFQVLDGLDQVENVVAAGIFNSSVLGQVGCLVRVEGGLEGKCTVRATNEFVSKSLCRLLVMVMKG